jgi:hypothetical protein
MENDLNKRPDLKDFSFEYNEIMKNSENSVVIENQWVREGDYFQKLSLYDESYIPVKTLGSTTLLHNF